jgi:hypothetical protein
MNLLIAHLLLESSKKDPVQHIGRGIHHLSPEPHRSPMPIEHCPGHLTQVFVLSFPPQHSGEAYTDSKTGVQDTSHGKRFRIESF